MILPLKSSSTLIIQHQRQGKEYNPMTDYEKQALDFLQSTGSTLSIRYLRTGSYFPSDKESQPRDIWEVELKRGNRSYVFQFGSSIKDREDWQRQIWNTPPYRNATNMTEVEIYRQQDIKKRQTFDFGEAGKDNRPTTYDILACLSGYEPTSNIDEFAEEFGYAKPSEAIRTFEAVHKEWQALQSLYSDEELQRLADIC